MLFDQMKKETLDPRLTLKEGFVSDIRKKFSNKFGKSDFEKAIKEMNRVEKYVKNYLASGKQIEEYFDTYYEEYYPIIFNIVSSYLPLRNKYWPNDAKFSSTFLLVSVSKYNQYPPRGKGLCTTNSTKVLDAIGKLITDIEHMNTSPNAIISSEVDPIFSNGGKFSDGDAKPAEINTLYSLIVNSGIQESNLDLDNMADKDEIRKKIFLDFLSMNSKEKVYNKFYINGDDAINGTAEGIPNVEKIKEITKMIDREVEDRLNPKEPEKTKSTPDEPTKSSKPVEPIIGNILPDGDADVRTLMTAVAALESKGRKLEDVIATLKSFWS